MKKQKLPMGLINSLGNDLPSGDIVILGARWSYDESLRYFMPGIWQDDGDRIYTLLASAFDRSVLAYRQFILVYKYDRRNKAWTCVTRLLLLRQATNSRPVSRFDPYMDRVGYDSRGVTTQQ